MSAPNESPAGGHPPLPGGTLSIAKVEEGIAVGGQWVIRALATKRPEDVLFAFRQSLFATSYALGACALVLDSDADDELKGQFGGFRERALEVERQIRKHGIALGMERELFERVHADVKAAILRSAGRAGAQPG